MKTLTLFLSLLFSFPFVLSAQMVGETLQKVSAALDNRPSCYFVPPSGKYQCRESRNVLLDRCG